MIGLDNEYNLYVCKVCSQGTLKTLENISAKKSALGMLSPFQMSDFQFAYARV